MSEKLPPTTTRGGIKLGPRSRHREWNGDSSADQLCDARLSVPISIDQRADSSNRALYGQVVASKSKPKSRVDLIPVRCPFVEGNQPSNGSLRGAQLSLLR